MTQQILNEVHWYPSKSSNTWNIRDPQTLELLRFHPKYFIWLCSESIKLNPSLTNGDVALVWRFGCYSIWFSMDKPNRWYLFPGQLRKRPVIFEQASSHPWKLFFRTFIQLPALMPGLLQMAWQQWREVWQPPGGSKSPAP